MSAPTASLTVFQMNDTHGYLEPHPELVWNGGAAAYPVLGGYARITPSSFVAAATVFEIVPYLRTF
jgi:2',3'-cyclic-nucleotide 2'-phosphodiesterase (5'-nucleotidase family)